MTEIPIGTTSIKPTIKYSYFLHHAEGIECRKCDSSSYVIYIFFIRLIYVEIFPFYVYYRYRYGLSHYL